MQLAEVLKPHLSRRSDRPFRILDLCSGSGCIGLLLAKELSAYGPVKVLGVDVLEQAVQLGRKTAARHGLSDAIEFVQGDLFGDACIDRIIDSLPFAGIETPTVELIVSNPPYIPRLEYEQLDKSVKDHESPLALLGEAPIVQPNFVPQPTDGLDFYHRIRDIAGQLLYKIPGIDVTDESSTRLPEVVLEVGKGQAEKVETLFGNLRRQRQHSSYASRAYGPGSLDGLSGNTEWRCEVKDDFSGVGRSVWAFDGRYAGDLRHRGVLDNDLARRIVRRAVSTSDARSSA